MPASLPGLAGFLFVGARCSSFLQQEQLPPIASSAAHLTWISIRNRADIEHANPNPVTQSRLIAPGYECRFLPDPHGVDRPLRRSLLTMELPVKTLPSVQPGKGPRVISRDVEYMVREVKRYIVTRYEKESHEGGLQGAGSQSYGEFDNFHSADRVGRLCASGERASADDITNIKFTDTFNNTIGLNKDGTSEEIQ